MQLPINVRRLHYTNGSCYTQPATTKIAKNGFVMRRSARFFAAFAQDFFPLHGRVTQQRSATLNTLSFIHSCTTPFPSVLRILKKMAIVICATRMCNKKIGAIDFVGIFFKCPSCTIKCGTGSPFIHKKLCIFLCAILEPFAFYFYFL